MDTDSRITEGFIYSAPENARTGSQDSAFQEDSSTVPQQEGAEGASAASQQPVTVRSVHLGEGHGRSVRKYIPMSHRHIVNVGQARNFLSESDRMPQLDFLKIKKHGGVTLPDGEAINQNQCLKWLSSAITCYLICNQLDEAATYINFAVDTVNSEVNTQYSNYLVGRIYFLKLNWCLKKLKKAALEKELVMKFPEALSAQRPDALSGNL